MRPKSIPPKKAAVKPYMLCTIAKSNEESTIDSALGKMATTPGQSRATREYSCRNENKKHERIKSRNTTSSYPPLSRETTKESYGLCISRIRGATNGLYL